MKESISDMDTVLAARVAANKTKEGAAPKSSGWIPQLISTWSGLGNLTKSRPLSFLSINRRFMRSSIDPFNDPPIFSRKNTCGIGPAFFKVQQQGYCKG